MGRSTPRAAWVSGMAVLSIAIGCADSRSIEGVGRDGAVRGPDASALGPSDRDDAGQRDGQVSERPDGGRDDGPTPPRDEALSLAQLECDQIAACSPSAVESFFFGGEEGCVASISTAIEEILARGHAAPSAQWCTHVRVPDRDCDGFRDDDGRSVVDCVEPAGRLGAGEVCVNDLECGRSPAGAEMRCLDCRCRPLPVEGEGCEAYPCANGFFCTAGGPMLVCRRFAALPEGAACSEVDPGAACAFENRCVDGVCVRRPRRGEVCEPDGVPCFEVTSSVGECAPGPDGVHRCGELPSLRVVAPGAPCSNTDLCAGSVSCPADGVCPGSCREVDGACRGAGGCNETTGECDRFLACLER